VFGRGPGRIAGEDHKLRLGHFGPQRGQHGGEDGLIPGVPGAVVTRDHDGGQGVSASLKLPSLNPNFEDVPAFLAGEAEQVTLSG